MEVNLNKFKKILSDDTKYKENSINVMVGSLRKINADLFGKGDIVSTNDFNNYEKVFRYLKEQKNNNQKTYAHAISIFMNTVGANDKLKYIYTKIFRGIAKDVDNQRIYQEPNSKEQDAFISWAKIVRSRDALLRKFSKTGNFSDFYDHYLLSLFTLIPPLRPQELCSAIVVDDGISRKKQQTIGAIGTDTIDANYYSLGERCFNISHSKTEKSVGTRIIVAPNQLHQLILKINSPYVVPTCDLRNHHSTASLSIYFKRHFKLTPVMLRKIYISHIIDSKMGPNERKKIAHIMGHSPSTQYLLYSKFAKSIHKRQSQ